MKRRSERPRHIQEEAKNIFSVRDYRFIDVLTFELLPKCLEWIIVGNCAVLLQKKIKTKSGFSW